MCAIVGVFRLGGVHTKPVSMMSRALSHRGPDEHTVRRYGGRNAYAAIGIERLAIVDPQSGQQPARDPSKRWVVILNGEIYNHTRIRKELQANGVHFQSRSDTEVVASLIATVGLERALAQCHGMFAMAVLDTHEKRLFLVRDRMGVKPLHWTQLDDGTVAFASEIKGLQAHPGIKWELNANAIQTFLVSEYVPTPNTIWSGVHKVEPGTWIEVNHAGLRHHRWWSPPVGCSGAPGNFERWASSLHGALQVATTTRMEAEVPIAYLLSGGIDSASVCAMAAERSNEPIHTFSMQVEGLGFDEHDAAETTAKILGAHHHVARIGVQDLEHLIGQINAMMDEPLADSSLLATWKLMQAVADAGFKCAISGDGADEILAGYPTYFAHRLAGISTPMRGALRRLVGKLPVSAAGVSNDYMAKRFVEGLGLPWQRRHQVWMGAWLPQEIESTEEIWERFDEIGTKAGKDPVARAMYLDQRTYLSDGVLVKVDRAAGAHGLEVRSPFMDHSVVELCAQMGSGHHSIGTQTKRVLRKAMESVLPEEVRLRPKKGFGAPVGPWLRGPATHLLDDLPVQLSEWIAPRHMQRCIDEHRAGIADHRRRLWSAFMLASWLGGPHGPSALRQAR